MDPQNSESFALGETFIAPPPEQRSSASSSGPSVRVELVAGSGPRLENETEALLRIRLRGAAIVLLSAVGAFFIRGFFVETPARLMQVVVCAAMAVEIVLLSSRRTISLAQLRGLELATFAFVALYLGIYEFELVLAKANSGSGAYALAAVKSCVLYFFAVILLYGTFIPNTWRRAARVIVPLAVAPLVVLWLLRLTSGAVSELANQVFDFEQISDSVTMLTLGSAAALYGTHIINTLRVQAFKARQMGQYHLKERLGAGGMGEVYLAEHSLLKRPCAIKLIRPESQRDPGALARFEREVRSTARLSHWNTVNIYDYGRTDDGTFYYVMELLHGMSLADLVKRHGPLPAGRTIHLLRQVCQALDEAHRAGLIHRDIKPANIFAAQIGGVYDVAKLLDFGLVRQVADRSAEERMVSGSPLFMAPEQAGGEAPDARSDIYSLGTTAYYLLTGKAPFERTSILEVMLAHAREPVVPPSEIRAGIPPDLERVVIKCLAKRPADRFPSAGALEQALAACQDAQSWTDADASRWWNSTEHDAGSTEEVETTSAEMATILGAVPANDSYVANPLSPSPREKGPG